MKKKKKPNKFVNAAERVIVQTFLTRHMELILQCGSLSHYFLESVNAGEEMGETAMEVEIMVKYLGFNLNYNEEYVAELWHKKDYARLLRVMCHECAHLATIEFVHSVHIESKDSTVSLHEERLTEHVSRWLLAAYTSFIEDNSIDLKSGKIK